MTHEQPRRFTVRYGAALAFADAKHRSHVRKDTDIPYVSHLISVSALVMEHGGDEDEAIAALLHDVIEDRGGSDPTPLKEEIEANFGARARRAALDALRRQQGQCRDRPREAALVLPRAGSRVPRARRGGAGGPGRRTASRGDHAA